MTTCGGQSGGNPGGGKLTNLSFTSVSATVLNIDGCNSRVLIEWGLKPSVQNLANLRFFIRRGESPEEMKRLNGAGITVAQLAEYVDTTANLIDFHKDYYYQVEAVEIDGDGSELFSFFSEKFQAAGALDNVQNYVITEHVFLFRHTAAGVPVMIFKKRHDGERCPECWDTVLKRVTKSNCRTCYGTGRIEGYYPPIEGWMGIDPNPDQSQVQMWGKLQPSQTTFRFTNYPAIHVNDLIVELNTNDLWKVTQVQFPERNRVRFLQNGVLDEVNRSDVEYKLEVPEQRRRELVTLHNAKLRGDVP